MAAPLFPDYLAERRILRRKLSYWQIAAIAAVILAAGAASFRLLGPDGSMGFTPHIARLAIEGIITGDRETLKLIQKIEDSKAAEAVLISIDSPGGTTAGAERLYEALRRLSAKKPAVAVVGSLAASGGYVAALGTDQIVALGNALVGSIGVLVQYPNFAKLLDTIGVKVEDVKSSPLKASPNGFEPTSPEARAALASLVSDSFTWFKALVKERRNMTSEQLEAVADGRVFTGRQGIELHLVDRTRRRTRSHRMAREGKKYSKRAAGKRLQTRTYAGTFGDLELFRAGRGIARACRAERRARSCRECRPRAYA